MPDVFYNNEQPRAALITVHGKGKFKGIKK
jgi:hypothetical protein